MSNPSFLSPKSTQPTPADIRSKVRKSGEAKSDFVRGDVVQGTPAEIESVPEEPKS